MHIRKRLAALLALALTVSILCGCTPPPKSEYEPKETPTGPGAELWASGQIQDNSVEYSHCGLRILLDSSYIAGPSAQDPNRFTFENGQIQGGIDFGTLPVREDGSTIASPDSMALYLQEMLHDFCSIRIGRTANGISYTEIHGDHFTIIRSFFIHRDNSWNLWLIGDRSVSEQMVQLISNASLVLGEIPMPPYTPSPENNTTVVEFKGLQISLPIEKVHENRSLYFNEFYANGISGYIRWSTILEIPADVDTIQEIAAYKAGVPFDAWDHHEYSIDGDTEKLVVYNDGHAGVDYAGKVRAYYLRDKFIWEVVVQGADRATLIEIVSNGKLDHFGYYRSFQYDLKEYNSLEAILQELRDDGFENWGRYTITINGLASPVTFDMYGAQIEAISAFGRTKKVSGASFLSDDGISYAAMGECTGAVWLNVICGAPKNSRIWVLTSYKNTECTPEMSAGVVLYPSSNGGCLFRRYHLRYWNASLAPDFDPLQWAVDRNEICYDVGRADIWNYDLVLYTDKSYTVAELYDLDALFAQAKTNGQFAAFKNLDALLETNILHYPN